MFLEEIVIPKIKNKGKEKIFEKSLIDKFLTKTLRCIGSAPEYNKYVNVSRTRVGDMVCVQIFTVT